MSDAKKQYEADCVAKVVTVIKAIVFRRRSEAKEGRDRRNEANKDKVLWRWTLEELRHVFKSFEGLVHAL